jgi:hypothetical protein
LTVGFDWVRPSCSKYAAACIGITPAIPQTFLLAPGGEALDGLKVGAPGVRVADVDGEELPKAPSTLGDGLEEHG